MFFLFYFPFYHVFGAENSVCLSTGGHLYASLRSSQIDQSLSLFQSAKTPRGRRSLRRNWAVS